MPKDTGDSLGSNLERLLVFANVEMPNIADRFEKAAAKVADTNQADSVAFVDGVATAWQTLRNEYLALLSQSQGNVQDCATALVHVVNDYATQDHEAGTQLRNLMKDEYPDIKGPGKDCRYDPPKFDKPEYIDHADEPTQLPRGDKALR